MVGALWSAATATAVKPLQRQAAQDESILRALRELTGWDPRHADLVLGTSAGAQVGALLRAGMSAADLSARVSGGVLSAEGADIARHYTRERRLPLGAAPAYGPAAPAYLRQALRRPWRLRPGRLAAAPRVLIRHSRRSAPGCR